MSGFIAKSPRTYPPNSLTAIKRILIDRAPTTADFRHDLFTQWLDTSSKTLYALISKTESNAIWVQLGVTGGLTPFDTITIDDSAAPGVNPVTPQVDGNVTFTGGQIAASSLANVIRTYSDALNELQIQIQRSSAVGASQSDQNGVCHFDSSTFAVDAGGYVTLIGGGTAIDSFLPDSGTSPVVPDGAGEVALSGGTGITTEGGTNTVTFNIVGGGSSWSDQSGAFNAAESNGYFITATSTATLPLSPSDGAFISFIVDTTDFLTIQGNASQTIRLGNVLSSAAGTMTSTLQGDSVSLIYRDTNNSWICQCSPVGEWLLA